MSKKRIAIAAGGTGGHVFPVLSLAHHCNDKGYPLVFIGGGLQSNPFFEREVFPYREVSCERLSLKSPNFPLKVSQGVWQSERELRLAFRMLRR